MKGLIIVHGTSQDITSEKENTVKLAKAARAAGHLVIEIGGPGSTERVILRSLKNFPDLAQPSYIDEIGLPLDHLWEVMVGTAVGGGIDDIVQEVEDAVMKMLKAGVTSIDLLGFSRGAVSLALALERIGQKLGKTFRSPIPIGVCLLDPVPGPYLVPREARLPSFLDRVLLLTSKHEGRPGFGKLGLSVPLGTRFTGDLIMGVHGDIGGSTGSAMTRLIRDTVASFLGLAAYRLSRAERWRLTMEVLATPSTYTSPGLSHIWSRRGIGFSGHEHERGAIELPSAAAFEDLGFGSSPPSGVEKEIAPEVRFEMPKPWQPPKYIPLKMFPSMIVVPTRPVRGHKQEIVFPPSRVVHANPSTVKKFLRCIEFVAKKLPK